MPARVPGNYAVSMAALAALAESPAAHPRAPVRRLQQDLAAALVASGKCARQASRIPAFARLRVP